MCFIVFAVVAVFTYVAFFGLEIGYLKIYSAREMRFGIDIRGGVEAIYVPRDGYIPTADELESARKVMETRLDAQNIADREITTSTADSTILIRFPWKSDETEFDSQKAITELGETAQLTFQDPNGNVLIEGKNVKSAAAWQNTQTVEMGQTRYSVQLQFDAEGAQKFEEATGSLVGQRISIYMDDLLISAPNVNEPIAGGTANITNMSSLAEAKELADKINAGALPFSMETKSNSTISPKLGSSALSVMLSAGILSFILICLFMLGYYRLPGFIACIALLLQALGQLLALSIPQFTLTLPGIAAIILSVGMGADANVIIAERIKEELNDGKSLKTAIDLGMHRAFSAVIDGNMTVVIVAILLMIFGSGSILSFGYSLLTGVILNFAVGVATTRIMLKSLSSYKFLQNPVLYGARRKDK